MEQVYENESIPSNDERLNELTERIIGCAFTVANTSGSGFLEKVYENSLVHELCKRGLRADPQHPIPVYYHSLFLSVFISVNLWPISLSLLSVAL